MEAIVVIGDAAMMDRAGRKTSILLTWTSLPLISCCGNGIAT